MEHLFTTTDLETGYSLIHHATACPNVCFKGHKNVKLHHDRINNFLYSVSEFLGQMHNIEIKHPELSRGSYTWRKYHNGNNDNKIMFL
jgi:hypothetical protein